MTCLTYKDDQTCQEKPHTQMIPSWRSVRARSVLTKIMISDELGSTDELGQLLQR